VTFLFASRRRWRGSEQWLLNKLVTEFDAVEVTGLSAFERAKRVYGTGLAEGEPSREERSAKTGPSLSASSAVQDPLFAQEPEAA